MVITKPNTLLNISQSRKSATVLFCEKNHNLQEKVLSPYTFQTKQRHKSKWRYELQFKQLTIQQICLKLQSAHWAQNNTNTLCFSYLPFLSVMISNTEKWICYKYWGFLKY